MNSEEYWENRAKLEDAQREATYDEVISSLSDTMTSLNKRMTDSVNAFVTTYQLTGKLNWAALKKRLSKSELRYARKVIKDLGKEGGSKGAEATAMFEALRRVNRIDALGWELKQYANIAGTRTEEETRAALERIYRTQDTLHGAAVNSAMETDIRVKLQQPSPRQIEAVLEQRWLGSSFSERLWKNTDALHATLVQQMPRLWISGAPQSEIAKLIAKTMSTTMSNVNRLLRTEGARVATAADRKIYADLGLKDYEYMATLDRRTSDVCRRMDGKTFALADLKEGYNAPPMHPNCRSTTVPAVDVSDISERDWLEAQLDVAEKYGSVALPKTQEQRDKRQRATVLSAKEIRAMIKKLPEQKSAVSNEPLLGQIGVTTQTKKQQKFVSVKPKTNISTKKPQTIASTKIEPVVQPSKKVEEPSKPTTATTYTATSGLINDTRNPRNSSTEVRDAVARMSEHDLNNMYAPTLHDIQSGEKVDGWLSTTRLPRVNGEPQWDQLEKINRAMTDEDVAMNRAMQYELSNNTRLLTYGSGRDDLKKAISSQRITGTEERAINYYTGVDYADVNRTLAGLEKNPDKRTESVIRNLRTAFDHTRMDRDLVTVRGSDAALYEDWEVGARVQNPTVTSTSMSYTKAAEFARSKDAPCILEYRIPQGSRAMYLDGMSDYGDSEAEVLLGPGITLKVIERSKDEEGRIHITLEVVPD